MDAAVLSARGVLVERYRSEIPPVAEVVVVDVRSEKRIAWKSIARSYDSGGKHQLVIGDPIDLSRIATPQWNLLLDFDYGKVLWRNIGGAVEISLDRRAGVRTELCYSCLSYTQTARGFVSAQKMDPILMLPNAVVAQGLPIRAVVSLAGDNHRLFVEIAIQQ